ncbi:MAG: hypothetical protein SFT93_04595 [Rickettsiaceae bacterium]|nr:hypothetical protein [Rickettsiaceae bacterium]
MAIELNQIKISAAASSLAYEGPDETCKYYQEKYRDLTNALGIAGDNVIQKPIPFWKKNVPETPAGYVIETRDKVIITYHGTHVSKFFSYKFSKFIKETVTGKFLKGLYHITNKSFFSSGAFEVLNDLRFILRKMQFGQHKLLIHAGFRSEFLASKISLYNALKNVDLEKNMIITGHSLGGALSQIASLDAVTNAKEFKFKIDSVNTFGGPRVFSPYAAKIYRQVGLAAKTYRMCIDFDLIAKIPPFGYYEHAGQEVKIKGKMLNPISSHLMSYYESIKIKRVQDNRANLKLLSLGLMELYGTTDYEV